MQLNDLPGWYVKDSMHTLNADRPNITADEYRSRLYKIQNVLRDQYGVTPEQMSDLIKGATGASFPYGGPMPVNPSRPMTPSLEHPGMTMDILRDYLRESLHNLNLERPHLTADQYRTKMYKLQYMLQDQQGLNRDQVADLINEVSGKRFPTNGPVMVSPNQPQMPSLPGGMSDAGEAGDTFKEAALNLLRGAFPRPPEYTVGGPGSNM